MSHSLANAGCEIVPLHDFKRILPLAALAKKFWAHGVLRRYYEVRRHPAVLQSYARQIEARLGALKVKAVFSTGTHLTAHCRLAVPLFFWADATVPALFALYPGYEKFWKLAYREAVESEKQAVANATAMFFSSDWAADSAVRDLGADPARVHVISFGANFEKEPGAAAALAAADVRSRHALVLLFAGVDWKRKGGVKAIAIAQAVTALGIQVELHILGIEPAGQDGVAAGGNSSHGPNVRGGAAGQNPKVIWHGRISKATEEGRRQIENLFARAHFFLLPTIADCSPMVFAEANAFAVPVVTHRLGGIPTMIRDGANGRMFPLSSSPAEQAGWIAEVWRDESLYRTMTRSSRFEYDARLNWRCAAKRVVEIVRSHVAGFTP